jgi:hypothetical protein
MHSKMKGNLGEAAVIKDLIINGFAVFKEIGDLSKVDLIAEKDNKLIKIQVKAATSSNGSVNFKAIKSGPNYRFRYQESEVDIFAFYCLDCDVLGYMKASTFLSGNKDGRTFRVKDAKNNQSQKIIWLKDLTLVGLLRDYT